MTVHLSEITSGVECARELGIRVDRVREQLSLHNVPSKTRQTSTGQNMLVIGALEMRQIKDALATTQTHRGISKTFGLPVSRQDLLVDAGLLRRIGKRMDGKSVLDLLQRIAIVSQHGLASNSKEFLPLQQILRTMVPVQATVQFFQAILSKKIAVKVSSGAIDHVNSFEISTSDTQIVVRDAMQAVDSFISIPDAATMLNLKQEVIYHLVNQGLIKIVHRQLGRRAARFIKRQELDRFNSRSETLACAALRAGVSTRVALTWAQNIGLKLISGPKIDGGRQYFVHRIKIT